MHCTASACASCSGCGSGGQGCSGCSHGPVSMRPLEAHLLSTFGPLPFQPVCRLTAAEASSTTALAIAPFFLSTPQDDLEEIAALGNALGNLAARGLISIDYTQPLQGCTYAEYDTHPLVCTLQGSAQEFLLEKGSMALTGKGQAVLDGIDR